MHNISLNSNYQLTAFVKIHIIPKWLFMCLGTCDILNGGCGEICIPEGNGRRCECDVGLQLQTDQSCDSGLYPN